MERIICLAIGYLIGMFQTSYIIGKIHHMDIRQYGSGNAGTTNALRTLGKKAGAMGDVGCFSFFPTKNLGCAGDGGIITTNDEEVYKQCLALRVHGRGMNGLFTYGKRKNIDVSEENIDFN